MQLDIKCSKGKHKNDPQVLLNATRYNTKGEHQRTQVLLNTPCYKPERLLVVFISHPICPHPQKLQKYNKPSLGTFECSLLQRVQKENTKTSLWTFKCNLIQKVQKEISKSSLGTFKCSLGTYDFEMTPPPPHPYSNPVKSLISTFFTDQGPMVDVLRTPRMRSQSCQDCQTSGLSSVF